MNDFEHVNRFVLRGFAERLSILLQQQKLSQNALANAIGVSRSTVTGWIKHGKFPDVELLGKICDELQCSADWLLGLNNQSEKQSASGNVRWIEQIPVFIDDFQRQQIEHGIQLFNLFVGENQSASEIRDLPYARLSLQAALRSGALRITHVARHDSYEQQIKQLFPTLREVIVADSQVDDRIICTELVTFLAATQILNRVIRERAVGLGSGYTMLRLCEQSIPGVDQFSGTSWIPLLAFAPENTDDYTANYLARFMSIRHPGSRAYYLPHVDENHDTLRQFQNLQTIFVSVSGVERRDRDGEPHILTEFRSADYAAQAPFLRETYARMEDKEQFGGELLRYLLDMDGNIIGRDPAVGTQVDLEILRYVSSVGRVCVVAARSYKAKPVLMCLQNHLVNSLVIDKEIAEYVLNHSRN